jgi:hypothetical protein
MTVLVSDFMRLAKSLIKLAEENGVNKEAIQTSHTILNKSFDFSKTTIQQLIQDEYQETKEQMK